MKLLVLVLTILFSYSIFADCCNCVEYDQDCKIEASQKNQCNDSEHSSNEHEVCQCTLACSAKILRRSTVFSVSLNSYQTETYYSYNQNFQGITLGPVLRPP